MKNSTHDVKVRRPEEPEQAKVREQDAEQDEEKDEPPPEQDWDKVAEKRDEPPKQPERGA